MSVHHAFYSAGELGWIKITASDQALMALDFCEPPKSGSSEPSHDLVRECVRQLDEYFQGKRRQFSIPLQLHSTEFRLKVWMALLDIPYGQTASYQDIAIRIGNPKATRAVGGANHHNPISIIIPCHRVIGQNHSMTGYGGGIWRKEWLLRHEESYLSQIDVYSLT
ncbi:MAG: methylated-DNA--[protein]-cysteine S-methyltransferase [Candidatus Delongbacteria bacterium]|nr:methylated-DNA--[protein]-cysteine S-methyltransferase [Candidatus Delongbacteria bacterium]